MSKLLPCPFCGGKGRLHQNPTAQALWRVICENCDAGPHGSFGETGAKRLWNDRPDSTPNVAQTPVTDELVNAGAQALADDVWHPPQKLSFLSPSDQNKFRRQSRTVIEAIRSVGLRGALAQAVDEHASMLSEGERREDAGDVPTLIELAIEREEKYLHDLIDDEAVGSVMHGDIEGAFHRLNAALTAARDTEGK